MPPKPEPALFPNAGTAVAGASPAESHFCTHRVLTQHPSLRCTACLSYQTPADERPSVWFEAREVWEIRGADLTISPVGRAASSAATTPTHSCPGRGSPLQGPGLQPRMRTGLLGWHVKNMRPRGHPMLCNSHAFLLPALCLGQVHKAAVGRVHEGRGIGLRFPRFLRIR